MNKLPRTGESPMPNAADFTATLAHHDAAIQHLGGRITGVESGLRTLQSEVHAGFSSIQTSMAQQLGGLASKLDKLDAAPKFDFHRMVSTVVSLAGLFALICAGIIYITNSQNAALIAEQKAFNAGVLKLVERHEDEIDVLRGWKATVTASPGKRGL